MKKHLCRKFFVLLFSLVMIATASFALAACGKKEAGPETGSYYYETELGETYYVTLTGGDKVSLLIKGETLWGDYKLSDGTFGFTLNSDAKIEGSYADNTVTIVMDGSQMIFRKAENYTVSFDTNGGSSVASQKVLNGKSAVKPADKIHQKRKQRTACTDCRQCVITQEISCYCRIGKIICLLKNIT